MARNIRDQIEPVEREIKDLRVDLAEIGKSLDRLEYGIRTNSGEITALKKEVKLLKGVVG